MDLEEELEKKHARNRQERLRFIKEWARYVRTHPDDDWGEQLNELVDSQIESSRNVEHERPHMDRFRGESPLLNGDGDLGGDGDCDVDEYRGVDEARGDDADDAEIRG